MGPVLDLFISCWGRVLRAVVYLFVKRRGPVLGVVLFWTFDSIVFVNPLTPRVKPWVIQSFLTFHSMDGTLKSDHSLESCWEVLYCGAVYLSILHSM